MPRRLRLRRLRLLGIGLGVGLGVGLSALVLSGVGGPATSSAAAAENGDVELAARASLIDDAAIRLTGERQDASAFERALKQRLLLALAAVAVGVPTLGRRRVALPAVVEPALSPRWSPRCGRAPPLLSS
ncbi:MAG: hypothetical protein AB7H43_01670 [Acidimicrobiia bacterium]